MTVTSARFFLIAIAWAAGLPAHGADYPARPVRMIVAIPAGGNVDMVARLVGSKLSENLGKPFVVDNRGGAGGVIAEEITVRSPADGYTLLMVSLAHVVNPNLGTKLQYDPLNDLASVSQVTSVPNVLVVNNAVPARSVPDLIALAKARPGQLNYASSIGTTLYLGAELFKAMAGVDIVGINYKGGGLAVPDIEAGRVQMAFSVITTAVGAAKSGRIRMLAVTSPKRSPALPDLPAMAEYLPGYESTGWQGVLAPARTPRALIAKLSEEITIAMRSPDVRGKLQAMGSEPVGSTPEQFTAFRNAELTRVRALMAKAGITTP
jgi:tripartite-type tricarboxylate transporter receptor subunit TctC